MNDNIEVKVNKPSGNLVYSALICDDGTVLHSWHRHDFNSYTDKNGKYYMIDGGLDYIRWSGTGKLEAVWDNEPFEKVRKYAYRLHRYDGAVFLCNMSDEWLSASIEDMIDRQYGAKWHLLLLIKEKQYRIENEIVVKESAHSLID